MLFEMYYDGKLDQKEVNDYRERLEIVFENLFYSSSFQDITTRQFTMRFHHSKEFRYKLIDGVKVFVVMDLLYRDIEKGKWIIVDWKTGKESDDVRIQLAVYAYYLMTIFEADLDEIEIRNEYLLTGNNRTYVVNKQEIEKMLYQMRNSVQLMKQYQADILKN